MLNVKRLRLRGKLLVYFLLANLIVFLVASIGITNLADTSLQKTYESLHRNFTDLERRVSERFDPIYQALDSILLDQAFLRRLNEVYFSVPMYLSSYFDIIRDTVTRQNAALGRGMRLEIYGTNPTIIYDGGILSRLTPEVRKEPWCAAISEGMGTITMFGPTMNADGSDAVIFGRNIALSGNRYSFVEIVRVPNEFFQNIFAQYAPSGEGYLLSPEGIVLFSTRRDALRAKFSSLYPEYGDVGEKGRVMGRQFIFFHAPLASSSKGTRLTLVEALPRSAVNQDARRMTAWTVTLFVGGIALSVLAILLFINHICGRIHQITHGIERIRGGDYDVRLAVIGDDELTDMSRGFNQMAAEVNSLINERLVYERRLQEHEYQRKEAELLSLQSQVDPHFLVNFMEAVRARLLRDGNTAMAHIILNYTKFLRQCIDWRVDHVTLESELKVVREYLDIQAFRFRDKISYQIECDESLRNVVIPKFLIQPLVENAIRHGIENILGQGVIMVHAHKEGQDAMRIAVKDNGAGIEPEPLAILKAQLLSPEIRGGGNNIGLRNVAHRIRLFYGGIYAFQIDSSPGSGTTVQFTLPLIPLRVSE